MEMPEVIYIDPNAVEDKRWYYNSFGDHIPFVPKSLLTESEKEITYWKQKWTELLPVRHAFENGTDGE